MADTVSWGAPLFVYRGLVQPGKGMATMFPRAHWNREIMLPIAQQRTDAVNAVRYPCMGPTRGNLRMGHFFLSLLDVIAPAACMQVQ